MKTKNPFAHLDCEFILNESRRAKRMSLRIKPPNIVTLTYPYGSSVRRAIAFAIENLPWIEQKLERAKTKRINASKPITSTDNFETKFHRLTFVPNEREEAFIRISNGETRLYYPQNWEEKDKRVQELIRVALRETYRKEAKGYLPERLKDLAAQHGFSYHKVSIRDSKRRWGSCSTQKNISLSLSLMALPYHLIDYILLHELCHTVEMNHSPRFHALLNKVCDGKSKALQKEMKQFSTL